MVQLIQIIRETWGDEPRTDLDRPTRAAVILGALALPAWSVTALVVSLGGW